MLVDAESGPSFRAAFQPWNRGRMALSDPQLRSISIGIPIGKLRRPQFLGRKAAQFFGPNSGSKNGAASGSDGFDSLLWLDLDAAQILRPRSGPDFGAACLAALVPGTESVLENWAAFGTESVDVCMGGTYDRVWQLRHLALSLVARGRTIELQSITF